MPERRKEVRIPVPYSLEVKDQVDGAVVGTVANISSGGLMLLAQRYIEPGRVMQFSIPMPDELITSETDLMVGVESVWCEEDGLGKQHWCGFQIIDYPPGSAEILERLIAEFS